MKTVLVSITLLISTFVATAQSLTLDLGLGINKPTNTFKEGYQAKTINGVTFDAGIRYMFTQSLGAKLDIGYNRIGHANNSPLFKTNYTRVNLQAYYNIGKHLYDLRLQVPNRLAIFIHGGPGVSFINPLSAPYTKNDNSAFNLISGAAVHYGLTDRISVYADFSTVINLGQKYNFEGSALDSSTNTMLYTITFGVSISINSDCYFCDNPY